MKKYTDLLKNIVKSRVNSILYSNVDIYRVLYAVMTDGPEIIYINGKYDLLEKTISSATANQCILIKDNQIINWSKILPLISANPNTHVVLWKNSLEDREIVMSPDSAKIMKCIYFIEGENV